MQIDMFENLEYINLTQNFVNLIKINKNKPSHVYIIV